MKSLVAILSVFIFVGCQGERGPMGPEGPPGTSMMGQAFEVEANFNEGNDYSRYFDFPSNIEVYESDIVAVYLLWEVDGDTGYDVWQPLPVSVFFDDGELQYAFDHTVADVQLFLTGDTDLSTVGSEYTQSQIFRVVVLPAEYVESNKVDMSNMSEVMKAVDESKVERLQPAN